MKVGDLIEKANYSLDLNNPYRVVFDSGKVGCIIKIETNSVGTQLVTVLTNGSIKIWPTRYAENWIVRVINEE